MPAFVLVVALILANGASDLIGAPYNSQEECEAKLAKIPKQIGHSNAKGGLPIVGYSAACIPMKNAPKGDPA